MNYLSSSEYESHGLEATVADAWVTAASSLIDAHCRRKALSVSEYTERLRITRGRNAVHLSYLPLAPLVPAISPIVSARARYAMPRRGESLPASNLGLSVAADSKFTSDVALAFGLPGEWTVLDPASLDWCAETGEVTFPVNALGLSFNEIEVTYTAGLDPIPDVVKSACAQIVRNAQATPALNVRSGSIDRMMLEYFSDTLIDASVRAMLAPWVAQKVA